jgi:hypothetical protein
MAARSEEVRPDGTRRISIRLIPAPGVRAFAVEETLLGTGAVLTLSGDGMLSPTSRTLRWGPYFGSDPVEVGYEVAAGIPGFRASGRASFDGQGVGVHTLVTRGDGAAPPQIGMDPLHDGAHQISIDLSGVLPGKGYVLEVSSDLNHWTAVETFTDGPGAGFARDAILPADSVRFYRAVPR